MKLNIRNKPLQLMYSNYSSSEFHLLLCTNSLKMKFNFLKDNKELKKALKIIWILTVSLSFFIIIISPFASPNFITSNIPICESKKVGKECFLCGSTRAFLTIGKLEFKKAYELNKLSVFLFTTLLTNILIFIIYLIKKSKKL